MNRRKWMIFYFTVISTLLLSGCWGKRELTDLAIIAAISLDKDEKGNYVKGVQLLNPGSVAGGLQGGGGGSSPPFTVFKATGDTILEAHSNLSSKVSRVLYHPHANLLVIGEDLAREEGIRPLLDSFDRNAEARLATHIVIARDAKAEDILKLNTAIDKVGAVKINRTVEFTEKALGESLVVTVQDFVKGSTTSGLDAVVGGFSIVGDVEKGKKMENVQQSELDARLEADGLAVFKEGKLIDWYDGDMAKGVLWMRNKLVSTDVPIEWKGTKHAILFATFRQETKLEPDTSKKIPSMTIQVRTEGRIREVSKPVKLDDPATIAKIEKTVENEIKKHLEATINRSQKNKTDVLGFGQTIHHSDPELWKKIEKEWNDVYFPKVTFNVKVDAFIRNSGTKTNSFLSDIKE